MSDLSTDPLPDGSFAGSFADAPPRSPLFMKLDGKHLQSEMLHLLCRIAKEKGRIEITNCEGGTCVLISKEELDSLEEALEIMAGMDGGVEPYRQTLAALRATCLEPART